jgi:hypothetical protein
MIVSSLVNFHGFDGIKHLMLVMLQIMLFQKSSWLLHVIYVMIVMGELGFSAHYFKLFILLVFILDINMMLAIDFHVLVLQWLMENK